MCGVFAAWCEETLSPAPILKALHGRGPDDQGFVQQTLTSGGLLHLFHTRLAIVDLSPAGHQPMATDDGNLTLIFNGEIYNHSQLRLELKALGCTFYSHSDTEVLLQGFRIWGTDVFSRLEGIFSCVLWDVREQRLTLARDPRGVKPLLWWRDPSGWAVGSELEAFRAARLPRNPRLDHEALDAYWLWGSIQAPRTIIRQIAVVPPGHWAQWQASDAGDHWQLQGYHHWPQQSASLAELSYDEAVQGVRQRLEQAVARQMLADVPVGAFLSGGLDSAAITALMGSHTDRKVATFSLGFREAGIVPDERTEAEGLAQRLGTQHTSMEVGVGEAREWFADFVQALDQPSVDGFNTYLVARTARQEGLTVALSGLGSDEIFAGYPCFAAAGKAQQGHRMTSSLRRRLPRRVLQRLGWDHIPFTAGAAFGSSWFRQLHRGQTIQVPPVAQSLQNDLPGLDIIGQLSCLELSGYMSNTLLRDSDALTMHHGLELRVPFLDGELVDFVLRIPMAFKLKQGISKPLLSDAISPWIPADVLSRKKRGFELPFAKWLQSWPAPRLDPQALGPLWLQRVAQARRQFSHNPQHFHSWWQWIVLDEWLRSWPGLI